MTLCCDRIEVLGGMDARSTDNFAGSLAKPILSTAHVYVPCQAMEGKMSFVFSDFLNIAPIPVSSLQAARQSVVIGKKIEEAGGPAAGRDAAVAAIMNATTADEPTEIRRLRLLYQRAYSEAELGHLVDRTFDFLGFLD
jgi:hypothetical protein